MTPKRNASSNVGLGLNRPNAAHCVAISADFRRKVGNSEEAQGLELRPKPGHFSFRSVSLVTLAKRIPDWIRLNSFAVGFAALLVAGCTTPGPTLSTTAESSFRPSANDTFAFMPEPNMRPQKRDFIIRASSYLAKNGFRISDPKTADYLIAVVITGPATGSTVLVSSDPHVSTPSPVLQNNGAWGTFTGPPALTSSSSHPSALPARPKRTDYGKTAFAFGLFRRTDMEKGNAELVWSATVMAVDTEFRAREEEFVVAVFSHAGESFSGPLGLDRGTKQ